MIHNVSQQPEVSTHPHPQKGYGFSNKPIWLSAKRCANGGSDFWLSHKIHFKHFVLLLLCVCVHNWSVSQWKQYELQIWSNWRKKKKLKVKSATEFDPWKSSRWVLLVLSFTYMTNQNITSVTDLHRGDIALHNAYKIDYHLSLIHISEPTRPP